MGKRLLLNGGENAHLFPVVSELRTTVETNHIGSRKRGGLTAALSWLAGLGKADSFVPASEQSVKDLHNLLPAVAFDFLKRPSNRFISNLRHYLGWFKVRAVEAQYLCYCK
jgi:hypothetical protein